MKPVSSLRVVRQGSLAAICAAIITSHSAQATDQAWDGGSSANANWSTVGNRLGDPATPSATSTRTTTNAAETLTSSPL